MSEETPKQFKYTVVESAENPKDSIIAKEGVVVKFSMNEVEAHEVQLRKLLTQLESQSNLEKAKITNVEQNHPFVKEMSDQDRFTVHLYHDAVIMVNAIAPKLEEVKKQIAEYEAEKIDISAQTGVPIGPQPEPTPTPEVGSTNTEGEAVAPAEAVEAPQPNVENNPTEN